MRTLNRVIIYIVTFLSTTLVFAGNLTIDIKEKIAEALITISKTEHIILKEDELLQLNIDGEDFDIDLDLVRELEKNGLIDRDTVARDGARCTERT